MAEFTHGYRIDESRCEGRLACMRACPTRAIRVQDGKAHLHSSLCIDCGACLSACPTGARQAVTQSFSELDKFRYKVAIPAPVLFGQFPPSVTPAHVVAGLERLGFDGVWDMSVELALVNHGIAEYAERFAGPYPLVSVSCPVIVRLVQVLYPDMTDQLLSIQPARELAAREVKRHFSEELGVKPGDIGAIYISACQAKTISILEPAEGAKSTLDGSIGIRGVYNAILAAAKSPDEGFAGSLHNSRICGAESLRGATSQAHAASLLRHRYMSVTGLANVIQVFDDIEKGKLQDIEFLECYGCWGGCAGGNLTVDNIYVTLSKLHRLLGDLPEDDPEIAAEVERRYPEGGFPLEGRIKPRVIEEEAVALKERIKRVKAGDALLRELPDLDCGLCGAPTCKTFSKDVAAGCADREECIFFSDDHLERLRTIYLRRE